MPKYLSPGEWRPSLKMEKNSEKIIKETEENISVFAGPGAGKTELLAQRANFLLQTSTCKVPQKILALSFKADAVANIKNRVELRCGKELARRFHSSTFDAFFVSMSRRFPSVLPAWAQIPSDFNIVTFGKDYWSDYSNRKLDGRPFNYQNNPQLYAPDDLNMVSLENSEVINFWKHCAEEKAIDFSMYRSLAYTIVKNSKQIRKLFQVTYKYLFLDEFQDATTFQYDFLKIIFEGSDTVITAVGDSNQMIMAWAGANVDNFKNLENDFDSKTIQLNCNYRSSPKIVSLINHIIKDLTPQDRKPIIYESKKDKSDSEGYIGIKSFDTLENEADYIASYIKNIIEKSASKLTPNDFILVLRERAKDYFYRANPFFEKNELILRNEDALVFEQGIRIQDLMVEPLSILLILLIKFKFNISNYTEEKELEGVISNLAGYSLNNQRGHKNVKSYISQLISYIDLSYSIQDITTNILNHISHNKLKAAHNKYSANYLAKVAVSFSIFFQESLKTALGNIQKAVELYEGKNQVKLMTIHKSKGLEFNTVFFVNLDDKTWWGLSEAVKKSNEAKKREEKNNFFVGLSRAKERLFFTNNTNVWPPVIENLLTQSNLLEEMPDI